MPIATLPTLQSAGPLVVAPDMSPSGGAVLFIADVSAARILAFELPPEDPTTIIDVRVDRLGAKLASLLGVARDDVLIRGIAAHPVSHAVYLSVARGRGPQAGAVLVRVGADSGLSIVELDELPVTSFELDDAPAADDARLDALLDGSDESSQPFEINGVTLDVARVPLARSTVTDLAWIGGELAVAGMSNEEFSSRLRRLPYPFDGSAQATSVEIFHVDHGRYETESPIRALTSFGDGSGILATYTCTPVVHFSLDELRAGGLVRGRTVAVLGPTIGRDAYEVGPEFVGNFRDADPESKRFFHPSGRDGYALFDLPGFIGARLAAAGVSEFLDLGRCTYTEEDRFFSYRRATHRGEPDYGRQISAIALTP